MRWLLLVLGVAWAGVAGAQDAGVSPPDAGAPDAEVDAGRDVAAMVRMVDDAIEGVARSRNREGLRAFEREDYPTALRLFREAHDLDPRDAEITNNLAFLFARLGDPAQAEAYYRKTLALSPKRAIAHVNLADLLTVPGAARPRLREAMALLTKARQLKGNDWRIIRRQARVLARLARFDDAERLFLEAHAGGGEGAVALELGDFYRAAGKTDAALRWYRQVADPALAAEAAQRVRAVRIDLDAQRYGWQARGVEVPAQARALVERGGVLLEQGKAREAVEVLQKAVGLAPSYAEAHHGLAQAWQARKNPEGAELSYLRALVMAPNDARVLADFAAFLGDRARPAEAAWFLDRAVAQRPDWLDLQLRLAEAWQAAGEPARALRRVELYLARLPADTPAKAARALRRRLRAALPEVERAPEPADEGDQAAVGRAMARARSSLAAGRAGAAMAALADLDPEPVVLNLRGRVLLATGRLDAAAETFAASLALDEAQATIHEQRAVALQGLGLDAQARAHLITAEALGSQTAMLALARVDAVAEGWPQALSDVQRWAAVQAARSRLRQYLEAGAPGGARADAEALLADLDTRTHTVIGLGVAALVLLLGGGLGLWVRVWGGIDLGRLVQRHPEAGPEVQRVLSAIRHEVLKHNTMVLTGLADAIEAGQPFAEEAAWCRRSLLGEPGTRGTQSAHTRLKGYAAQLARLGRAHGERLNLRRKDPALSALLRGFRVLHRATPRLDRAGRLGGGGRARLKRALRQAAQLLNVEGYEAVRALLDRLRVLDLDPELLTTIFDRTRHEPAFADTAVADLDLRLDDEALPSAVVVPRYAFDDMLANLMRNAIQSSIRHCADPGPVQIGLSLSVEVDFITGLERVAFRILDRSPQPLTPEMLRGRYIEAGLGLTADLVSRYEGTLDVEEAAPPWQKAVVLKLPRHDDDEEA